jgi:hypothetical protein
MGFLSNPEIWWLAQIVLDAILLAAVFVLTFRANPGSSKSAAQGQAGLAAADFVAEASQLAREFDRLLGEKRELVGTTLATLDSRIEELKAVLEQLHSLKRQIAEEARIHPSIPARKAETAREPAPAAPLIKPASPESPFNLPSSHPLRRLTEDEPALLSDQDFRTQVSRMTAQGHTPQDIALTTGRPRAEVELMMALRKPSN